MMSGLNGRVKRQIALLAGDDLEGEQSVEARRSVDTCPHCRRHWVRVRGCLDMLGRAGKADLPAPGASLWPGIESRLRPAAVVRRSQEFNGWVPALSMAAACIALLIAGQLSSAPSQEAAISVRSAAFPGNWRPVRPSSGMEDRMRRYAAFLDHATFAPAEMRNLLDPGGSGLAPVSWTPQDVRR